MSTEPRFGTWLKQRRQELGLTRKELARVIGCSPVTIYKIEAGERRPSRQIADVLADFLGVPSDELPLFARFATSMVAQEGLQGSPLDHDQGSATAVGRALLVEGPALSNLPAPRTSLVGR